MQSHIALQLESATVDTITIGHLPHFCSWPIRYGLANFITLPEGRILIQSFSSYLAHIELYEYQLDNNLFISYTRAEPALFMLLMLDGYSALYSSPKELISESEGGSFYMGYVNKGSYKAKIKAGQNRLLLLTIRAEWLMRKTERLTCFKPITDQFLKAEQRLVSLPHCPLTQEVLKLVKKMFLYEGTDRDDLEITIDSILTQLIRQYHDMISAANYTTSARNMIKAKEIASFIIAHHAEEIVEDSFKLASMFNVSERQLLRLAKIAFTRSLHQQVIYCRMHYGLKYLMSTKKTIAEIATTVGYHDEKYFSKAFKKFFGILPGEIRTY